MPAPQPLMPLIQIGDVLNLLAPHNVLATLLTGGQYHAPIYSKGTAAEYYNPTQLGNKIPGITFSYLETVPYTKYGYMDPERGGGETKFWVYNKSNETKMLHIAVNQLLCRKVSTGGNFPCEYEAGTYPLVYSEDVLLHPGGAKEIKFHMYTPMVPTTMQPGDVERVRVEVNVTDEKGNRAKLAAMAVPQHP